MDGTTINNPNKHFNFNSKHMCTIILMNYNECALTMCVLLFYGLINKGRRVTEDFFLDQILDSRQS